MISLIANDADVEYIDETDEVIVSLDGVDPDSINTEDVYKLIDSDLYLEWLGLNVGDYEVEELSDEIAEIRNDIGELVSILKNVTEELEELS